MSDYEFSRFSRDYDIAPDGRKFLFVKRAGDDGDESATPEVILVQNWFQELERLVPTDVQ